MAPNSHPHRLQGSYPSLVPQAGRVRLLRNVRTVTLPMSRFLSSRSPTAAAPQIPKEFHFPPWGLFLKCAGMTKNLLG
uniref:Uncharacterized protein n=1 Tax=Gallus gallus TaxID=9031 RepID=A0A8V0YDE5_CHICK